MEGKILANPLEPFMHVIFNLSHVSYGKRLYILYIYGASKENTDKCITNSYQSYQDWLNLAFGLSEVVGSECIF